MLLKYMVVKHSKPVVAWSSKGDSHALLLRERLGGATGKLIRGRHRRPLLQECLPLLSNAAHRTNAVKGLLASRHVGMRSRRSFIGAPVS
jgi:hypothetical protein